MLKVRSDAARRLGKKARRYGISVGWGRVTSRPSHISGRLCGETELRGLVGLHRRAQTGRRQVGDELRRCLVALSWDFRQRLVEDDGDVHTQLRVDLSRRGQRIL